MCEILIDPKKLIDRRKNKLCIKCKKRRCEDIEDKYCEVCHNKWLKSLRWYNSVITNQVAKATNAK